VAEEPDAGQALGVDPARRDRDLLWSLIRRVEADLGGGSVGDLLRDLTLDPMLR
jgi:hypothetical protein